MLFKCSKLGILDATFPQIQIFNFAHIYTNPSLDGMLYVQAFQLLANENILSFYAKYEHCKFNFKLNSTLYVFTKMNSISTVDAEFRSLSKTRKRRSTFILCSG